MSHIMIACIANSQRIITISVCRYYMFKEQTPGVQSNRIESLFCTENVAMWYAIQQKKDKRFL